VAAKRSANASGGSLEAHTPGLKFSLLHNKDFQKSLKVCFSQKFQEISNYDSETKTPFPYKDVKIKN
jgi:hypothetical protein